MFKAICLENFKQKFEFDMKISIFVILKHLQTNYGKERGDQEIVRQYSS